MLPNCEPDVWLGTGTRANRGESTIARVKTGPGSGRGSTRAEWIRADRLVWSVIGIHLLVTLFNVGQIALVATNLLS